jgi:GntR family transcriptional regulator
MLETRSLYAINRQSKLPLYVLIEQNIHGLISSGQLKPNDALPSEWELSEFYGVSRLTVRHALETLVSQGWLNRRHGVGTFIASPSVTRISLSRLSFTEQMRAIGRVPSSRQLSNRITPATVKIASHLGLPEGAPVVEINRVRLADGKPILLETAYLSQERFPEITSDLDLSNGSLYEFLRSRCVTNVAVMDQTLEPVMLTEAEAGYLETQAGTSAILSEVVAYAAGGLPIEYSHSVTRGDQCKFYFSFRRGEDNPV